MAALLDAAQVAARSAVPWRCHGVAPLVSASGMAGTDSPVRLITPSGIAQSAPMQTTNSTPSDLATPPTGLARVPEVATALRHSERMVRKLLRNGVLPGTRIGRAWLVDWRDVRALLAARRREAVQA